MPARVTFLGHSAFLVEAGTRAVLIDPFLTGNPAASPAPEHQANDVRCTHIVLTHAHEDHFGDTIAIARRTGAPVYAAYEICGYIGEQGHDAVEPMNPGGRVAADFGYVALTQAHHSSSYQGVAMGIACGAIVHIDGATIYHAGDTALFGDMSLIGELYKPDVAILPVGDRFTMGPEHATKAAELVGAPIAIPCHYNTWPPIEVDLAEFKPKGVEVRALEPGAALEIA